MLIQLSKPKHFSHFLFRSSFFFFPHRRGKRMLKPSEQFICWVTVQLPLSECSAEQVVSELVKIKRKIERVLDSRPAGKRERECSENWNINGIGRERVWKGGRRADNREIDLKLETSQQLNDARVPALFHSTSERARKRADWPMVKPNS